MKKTGSKPVGYGKQDGMSPSRIRKAEWRAYCIKKYLQGNTAEAVRDMARLEFGHPFSSVFVAAAVRDALQEWKQDKAEIIENHKTIELKKINGLEAEYWDAWEKSRKTWKATTKTKTPAGDENDKAGKLTLSQTKEEEKPGAGDPRYLQGVQWCIDARCKLLGVDVPAPTTAIQINNNGDGSTTVVRRVVFKTRETTAKPQKIQNPVLEV